MPPRVEVERNIDLTHRHQAKDGFSETISTETAPQNNYRIEIVWRNVILMALLHIGAFIGLRQCFVSAQWKTIFCAYTLHVMGGIGITAGAHRLWSHRSYKAKIPYRVILACFNSMAFENSIYEWSRDHRAHHKYCETSGDPHDATRGFFFSHVGWLLCRKHPDVKTKGKLIDLSDVEADPIVRFQHRHYLKSVLLFCFFIPAMIPYFGWGESLFNSFYVCSLMRYVFTLHSTWLVNSVAHMWGRRPYDKHIGSTEAPAVSFFAHGEGFHNYHHVFPWDYSASELGYEINLTKFFIDSFAKIGWVYDRKSVSPDMIKQRKLRTGDVGELGSYGPHNY